MKMRTFILATIMSSSLFTTQAQKADSARLYEKVYQLFATTKMQDLYTAGVNETVNKQIRTVPALADHKEEVSAFFEKYMGWAVMRPDIARVYLRYYTPDEIDELIKFYKSPVGKKQASIGAPLQKEVVAVQQARIQSHVAELSDLIKRSKDSNNIN